MSTPTTLPANRPALPDSFPDRNRPRRVQRKRTKGSRLPPNTVCVTRPGKWGNPYYPGSGHARGFFDGPDMKMTEYDVRDPRVQVQWFREYAADKLAIDGRWLEPLRGKNLACWCAIGSPCHGDVLLELANSEPARSPAPPFAGCPG